MEGLPSSDLHYAPNTLVRSDTNQSEFSDLDKQGYDGSGKHELLFLPCTEKNTALLLGLEVHLIFLYTLGKPEGQREMGWLARLFHHHILMRHVLLIILSALHNETQNWDLKL